MDCDSFLMDETFYPIIIIHLDHKFGSKVIVTKRKDYRLNQPDETLVKYSVKYQNIRRIPTCGLKNNFRAHQNF